MDNRFPAVAIYRGIDIQAFQPAERIEAVVKPAIDGVFLVDKIPELVAIAKDPESPPEARLFAAAKARAQHELAANSRISRPELNLAALQAAVAGLDTLDWADPEHYCCLFDNQSLDASKRPEEYRAELEQHQEAVKKSGARR